MVYEYADGARLVSNCRQQPGCKNDMSVQVLGTQGPGRALGAPQGPADPRRRAASGSYDGPQNQMYQTEHDELFASIRSGKPINNGEYMARSTLLAIMGRMAAYTGQEITWEMALNSKEDLSPARYDWDAPPPASSVAVPGQTPFALSELDDPEVDDSEEIAMRLNHRSAARTPRPPRLAPGRGRRARGPGRRRRVGAAARSAGQADPVPDRLHDPALSPASRWSGP